MASCLSCHSWLAISSCGNFKMIMMKKLSKKHIVSSFHGGSGGGGRVIWLHGGTSKSKMMEFKCFSVKQDVDDDLEMDYRLFSNLNQSTFQREPGSITGSTLLVAGTTDSGFLASAVTCILCWMYMVVTGLLIAEVNVKTMSELGTGGVSLVSMAMRTLGVSGVQITCWCYIFIHYALLVAYVARSSDILTHFIGIPIWESATLFSLLFGGLCYFGSQQVIGAVNGALVFGILTSFTTLVVAASGDLHWEGLLKTNLEAIPRSIPIIALSFVYQNVVPVVCTNLEGNLKKVRTSIVLGTAIPLSLFLVWNAVILGTITGLETNADKITDPLLLLRSANGAVGTIVEVFSLLAIGTSYIGFVLGLADFLTDLLKLPSGQNRPLPYVLTLTPPLILSLLDPDIFFRALDFAGTYGVLVLFGILPAAMSWSDRSTESSISQNLPTLVPGGKLTLSFVIAASGFVIISEILENFVHV
ncbi:hypothetical protein AgCh_018945 [Apium graveolens]